ncbi:MAG: twin-arginine translocase TatA/TatE family subunit [Acidobacteriota bacterium]
MGPIGMQEMVVIFLVALVLFGPKKLPELGKTFAKAITEFRRAQSDLKATFEREMQSLEKETESLKEATRQATIDLTNYPDIDLNGSPASYDQRSIEPATVHPTVSASAIPGAELHAELSAPQTPNHDYGSMENHPSEADFDIGVQGTVPRGASESVHTETVAEVKSAPDESNPLPEFVQTGGDKAAKSADEELPSIV